MDHYDEADGGNAHTGQATWEDGVDILLCAVDMDSLKVWWGWEDVSAGSTIWLDSTTGVTGDPVAGTQECGTLQGGPYTIYFSLSTGTDCEVDFGQGILLSQVTTLPTGYGHLNSDAMDAPAISNPTKHVDSLLYLGDDTFPRALTGAGLAPDLVWIKNRDSIVLHNLWDKVRGVSKALSSDQVTDEATLALVGGDLNAFGSDGFTLADGTTDSTWNNAIDNYVAWNFKAGGAPASNTDGTITASLSANPPAGFSIATWTGTGVAGTIGHGLSVAPEMIIVKARATAGADSGWYVFHDKLNNGVTPEDYYLVMDTNAAEVNDAGGTIWNSLAPTSSVFSVGTHAATNLSGDTYLGYCFSSVKGFSEAGVYVGNGSTDGPYVNCGFRPAILIIKKVNATGAWVIYDNKRSITNPADIVLQLNSTAADVTTGNAIDMLANGFKPRTTNTTENASGSTYVYMAFADLPFKTGNAR
jgi:hypothetical protein